MDTQELNDELGVPGAQALLRSSPLCRLAYLGQDGLPRVIPIGFYWNGKRIVVCTATTSPKVRALESRPDVALTIGLPFGRATRDVIPMAVPQAEPFGDNSGRTDVGAKLARAFLTSLRNKVGMHV